MLATVAGVLATNKLQQTKNPVPYLWSPDKMHVPHQPWILLWPKSAVLW